ncbi:hypothetical protein HDE_12661 [Halotydeus destructor]|nr:hypothetical protein HDE_12661 [Halotydeus destructor]
MGVGLKLLLIAVTIGCLCSPSSGLSSEKRSKFVVQVSISGEQLCKRIQDLGGADKAAILLADRVSALIRIMSDVTCNVMLNRFNSEVACVDNWLTGSYRLTTKRNMTVTMAAMEYYLTRAADALSEQLNVHLTMTSRDDMPTDQDGMAYKTIIHYPHELSNLIIQRCPSGNWTFAGLSGQVRLKPKNVVYKRTNLYFLPVQAYNNGYYRCWLPQRQQYVDHVVRVRPPLAKALDPTKGQDTLVSQPLNPRKEQHASHSEPLDFKKRQGLTSQLPDASHMTPTSKRPVLDIQPLNDSRMRPASSRPKLAAKKTTPRVQLLKMLPQVEPSLPKEACTGDFKVEPKQYLGPLLVTTDQESEIYMTCFGNKWQRISPLKVGLPVESRYTANGLTILKAGPQHGGVYRCFNADCRYYTDYVVSVKE